MLAKYPAVPAISDARHAALVALTLALAGPAAAHAGARAAAPAAAPAATKVQVTLSEWKVELEPATIPAGPVEFDVRNDGKVAHGLEIEGNGLEKSVSNIPHGGTGTLRLTLKGGRYEAYCPIGRGSHKMLGMDATLAVSGGKASAASHAMARHDDDDDDAGKASVGSHAMAHHDDDDGDDDDGGAMTARPASALTVSGGGPVVQILPGPYPFADSAAAVIAARPDDQREDLTHKSHMGPYSNNVARIDGSIQVTAIDRGASGDSVSGVAQFTAQDGARWKVVMDRVQTKDIPDNPRFGGVIMGLYYHGASGVHTPLVPTIQSQVALWAFAHVYRNDQLVTDSAPVHIMLLSRTRRDGDFALECWDCSRNPVEELQLQVTPPSGGAPFESPGGFLFVNWEKSSAQPLAAR